MRPKRHFCRKAMAGQQLRRVRELFAQIVLFGVELGDGFGVGIDGASVSKSISESVSKFASAHENLAAAGLAK